MSNILIVLIIAIFVALVFVNFYFRVKVLKVYKRLVNNRVEFGTKEIFNKEKMALVHEKYPAHKADIELFTSHIRYSIKMATWLIVTITALGAVLMYYR